MKKLDQIIEIANKLHSLIYEYMNDEDNGLAIQGLLADADDLREEILMLREAKGVRGEKV